MIKMAAFDMDGTLLKRDKTLSNKNIEAIKLLLEQNVKVVIATGRPNTLMKEYVNKLNIDEFSVSCNGSVIYNHKNDEFLYHDEIDCEVLQTLNNYFVENDIDFLVYEKDYIASYSDNERHLFFTERNKTLKPESQAKFRTFKELNKKISDLNINKILIIESNKEKYQMIVKFLSQFEDLFITQSNESFIDIGPKGNSKGNALKILCNHYDIKPSEVIAFGDQRNDISMLKFAGIGVAMGNAKQDVKDIANEVTLSNEEDGVFHKVIELLDRKK